MLKMLKRDLQRPPTVRQHCEDAWARLVHPHSETKCLEHNAGRRRTERESLRSDFFEVRNQTKHMEKTMNAIDKLCENGWESMIWYKQLHKLVSSFYWYLCTKYLVLQHCQALGFCTAADSFHLLNLQFNNWFMLSFHTVVSLWVGQHFEFEGWLTSRRRK